MSAKAMGESHLLAIDIEKKDLKNKIKKQTTATTSYTSLNLLPKCKAIQTWIPQAKTTT
jgi:hypothetical protein